MKDVEVDVIQNWLEQIISIIFTHVSIADHCDDFIIISAGW